MKRNRRINYGILIFLTGFILVTGFKVKPSDVFPVPPVAGKTLFYVQRTNNTNTIMYELNRLPNGEINQENPVHIYWIRYAENGQKQELSYIQRKFAYGLNITVSDEINAGYKLTFVSYDDRVIYLLKTGNDKQYHAYIKINGAMARLVKIFVQIEGGTFWVPNVKWAELSGVDSGGKLITERFVP